MWQFVRVLRKYLPHAHTMEEEDLVTTLCMLFNEMDVNGDDRIQWEVQYHGWLDSFFSPAH